MNDVTFRYEVRLAERWVPYTAEALGVGEDDVEPGLHGLHGMRNIPVIFEPRNEFAARELDRALDRITAEDPGLQDFTGLRILLWDTEPDLAEGTPDVIVTATDQQLGFGRLRRARAGVTAATEALTQARARLRAQTVIAAFDDGLGRNQIARETDRALVRRLVLQYLAGHDLVHEVLAALPTDWPRRDGDPYTRYSGSEPAEPWEKRLGPFWCGPVKLEISTQGVVGLTVIAGTGPGPHYEATDDQLPESDPAEQQKSREAAEVVDDALRHRGLMAFCIDGKDPGIEKVANVDELATRQVIIERPSR